jgi:23S rRNA pseudouridine955/2504/2580 synthase
MFSTENVTKAKHSATDHTMPVAQYRVVQEQENEMLLDQFLQFHYHLNAADVRRLIRTHRIWIRNDGEKIRHLSPSTPLAAGDQVSIKAKSVVASSNEHSGQKIVSQDSKVRLPSALRPEIIYMDDDIAVINKSADMAVHGGSSTDLHLQHFLPPEMHLGREKPRLVHRLDKKTTGALVLARHWRSAALMANAFRSTSTSTSSELDVEKTYWAILTGVPQKERGKMDCHLYIPARYNVDISSESKNTLELPHEAKISIRHPGQVSPYEQHCLKHAVTQFEVIEPIGHRGAWVRLMPSTGRKHQLRVQCAQMLRAPILGDRKYGIRSYRDLHRLGWGENFDFTRATGIKANDDGLPMFLHLRQLVIRGYFLHPSTKKNRESAGSRGFVKGDDLVVKAPLPSAWTSLMKSLHFDEIDA